jgi:hypothetical protein
MTFSRVFALFYRHFLLSVMLSVIVLIVIMLSVIVLIVSMVSVIELIVGMMSVIVLIAIMLSVIVLIVIMLSVMYAKCHYALCPLLYVAQVCLYAKCHLPDCRGAIWPCTVKHFSAIIISEEFAGTFALIKTISI